MPLAILDGTDEIIYMQSDSQLPADKLPDVIAMATAGCKQIAEIVQRKVRQYGEKFLHQPEPTIPL